MQKDIELGDRGFSFAEDITHAQVELVRQLENIDLDIAAEYVPESIQPILKEEQKRRVLLSLLENALEVVEIIKEAQKHIAALEIHSFSGAVDGYLSRIVRYSFIQFEDPNGWETAEPEKSDEVPEINDAQPKESSVEARRIFKYLRTLKLAGPRSLLHKRGKRSQQVEKSQNETLGKEPTISPDQLLQQTKIVEAISDPLIWLEYNLLQITMGIDSLKKQISQLRKNTVEQIAQLPVDQLKNLAIVLGTEELRGIHTTTVLHKHASDLFIQ